MYKKIIVLMCTLRVSLFAEVLPKIDYPKTASNKYSKVDTLEIKFVGNWPFGPTRSLYYNPSDDLLYLGAGGGVYIIECSNPSTPSVISDKIRSRGIVEGLHVALGKLYIAAGRSGMEIWDISDSSDPIKIGALPLPGYARSIYVKENFAFVAAESAGLRIVDISDPANPTEIGYSEIPGSANSVVVAGQLAYIAAGDFGLRIINISTPSSPFEVGFYNTPGFAEEVFVTDTKVYVADGWTGLRIIDVSNPSDPQEVGYFDTWWASDVEVNGSFAYVADDQGGLCIIDVSDPFNPVLVGSLDLPSIEEFDKLSVAGPYAFVSDRWFGLRLVDVSNPSSPFEVGQFKTPRFANDVYVYETYLFVRETDGIYIIDAASPNTSQQIGFLESYARDFFISGSYAYVVDGSYFKIIDISDPSNLLEIGSYPLIGTNLFVSEQLAYITNRYQKTLYILDVSTPTNPSLISTFSMQDEPIGLFVSGQYLYLLCSDPDYWTTELIILDISDPLSPQQLGSCELTLIYTAKIFVYAGFVYIAKGDGIIIVDVSNPIEPSIIAQLDTPASDIQIEGRYAFVANMQLGISVYDVSDPSSPSLVVYSSSADYANAIHYSDPYIYVADGDAGLQVFELCRVAIDEENASPILGIKLYNNPASKEIRLFFNTSPTFALTISLYNTTGQRVKKYTLNQFSKSATLDINGIQSGIYFLVFEGKSSNLAPIRVIVR